MSMSNETRLKNIRRRHRKPKAIVVLYQDEGILYKGKELDEVVGEEMLNNLLVDEDVTLIVVSYEKMTEKEIYHVE